MRGEGFVLDIICALIKAIICSLGIIRKDILASKISRIFGWQKH